ncbi:hypothetical protein GJ336_19740 [Escherichia coli]|nr:hypothetical protein [Escherichia coli]
MIKFILLLFLMVCSCSQAASLFATSISDGSLAECEIVGLSHTQGDISPVALSIYCNYQTQNNRRFALAVGSSGNIDISMGCNGSSNMPLSTLGKVFNTTNVTGSGTGVDVSAMYPLGYLFHEGTGQVLCQMFFQSVSQIINPGSYIVGLFSGYQNQQEVWEFHGAVAINSKTMPGDFGAVYCSLIVPQSIIDMGIIKPKSESRQVNVDVGINCSGATTKIDTELGYTIRFDKFNCSTDCSLLGEYMPYPGAVIDPADDPEKGFIMHDVMPFKNGQTGNAKNYTTKWSIRDNTGNPREITASAHVEIYYY